MAANPMIRAMFPTGEQMKAHNIEIGHKRMGTYWMFENNEENWIKAFFGSREKQRPLAAGTPTICIIPARRLPIWTMDTTNPKSLRS